ncbi:MAG: hypothetical protein GSR73_06250 [Desulfurococcales archaeon]|nr:hypothetical protein [Desulfurococcales archaeon]
MNTPWPRPRSPLYNLTLEESLYRACAPSLLARYVLLWINHPSVIAGRLNRDGLDYSCKWARRLGVPVYRRFTGGGAVYHDHGVLSITLVGAGSTGVERVYRYGTGLLAQALSLLGLEPWIANEGDVAVGDCKVAGSAAHIGGDRFLYHATLILDADPGLIGKLTPPRLDKIRGGVDPVKYNPCGLKDLLGALDYAEVYRALESVGLQDGRSLVPLEAAASLCPGARGLQWRLLAERLGDGYWVPC